MIRTAQASFFAVALAVSPIGAAPALADKNSDIAAAAVLGALAIYGISQSNKKNKKKKEAAAAPAAAPVQVPSHSFSSSKSKSYQTVRYGHGILPLSCMRVTDSSAANSRNRDTSYALADRCLQRSGYQGRLPRSCETWIPGKNGQRAAYSAECLINKGYLVGGRP